MSLKYSSFDMTFCLIFRPHHLHAVGRCGLFLHMSHSATWHSLCFCVLGAVVSCAKTAEPIKMPFGGQTYVGPRDRILEIESRFPMGRSTCDGMTTGCNFSCKNLKHMIHDVARVLCRSMFLVPNQPCQNTEQRVCNI